MVRRQGKASFREVSLGLGGLPYEVKVCIRASDGENRGFVFQGQGMAQNDDDGDIQDSTCDSGTYKSYWSSTGG